MTSLQTLSPHQRYVLFTLVETAVADGTLAPLEVSFIEQLAERMGLDAADREVVRAMLLERTPIPWEGATAPPEYADRLAVYRDTVLLAASDGRIQPQERALLARLGDVVELSAEDTARIWRDASARFEPEHS